MAVEDAAPPLPLDAPVAVVCGHYGVGKTNLTLNIALDAAAAGRAVTVIDLDVVNPFFRSSDYRALLDERGIRLVAPVFAGTNVDGPSLSGTIEPAIDTAQRAWRSSTRAATTRAPRRSGASRARSSRLPTRCCTW